ncbi:MAG: hypothetical protein RR891_09870 [Clostridium sp.]|uniref:hypothetical protein n=1 Tax=Clostridium sp. TaxID=1506 RepID=UPI0030411D1B
MIKNKENISQVLKKIKGFSYMKGDIMVDVAMGDNSFVNIRYYESKCIKIDYYKKYDNAISTLYKDRKYINKVLFQ